MDERELSVIDGETLLDMNLLPPKFCVKTLLPQGLSILGGAPKVGKSWMVMDLCVRVAKGEPIWIWKLQKALRCISVWRIPTSVSSSGWAVSPMMRRVICSSPTPPVLWQTIWKRRF